MLDFGYPQNCSVDVLKMYINLGTVKTKSNNPLMNANAQVSQLTSQITGAIDWRRDGLFYKKNELYLDVLESVHILMSSTGTLLQTEVTGKVVMKALLSGMPECKVRFTYNKILNYPMFLNRLD